MKKARKVKVDGREYKYFLDKGAVDGDGTGFARLTIYFDNGERKYHNYDKTPKLLTQADVKEIIRRRSWN